MVLVVVFGSLIAIAIFAACCYAVVGLLNRYGPKRCRTCINASETGNANEIY